jgi:hypothetical protein
MDELYCRPMIKFEKKLNVRIIFLLASSYRINISLLLLQVEVWPTLHLLKSVPRARRPVSGMESRTQGAAAFPAARPAPAFEAFNAPRVEPWACPRWTNSMNGRIAFFPTSWFFFPNNIF